RRPRALEEARDAAPDRRSAGARELVRGAAATPSCVPYRRPRDSSVSPASPRRRDGATRPERSHKTRTNFAHAASSVDVVTQRGVLARRAPSEGLVTKSSCAELRDTA